MSESKSSALRSPGRRSKRPGTAPGTLQVDPSAPPPAISLIAYDGEQLIEERIERAEQLAPHMGRLPVLWVNVDGLGEIEPIERLGELLGLHPLALEDVLHVHQRPKVEVYGGHLFVILPMPVAAGGRWLKAEQVSLFLGEDFVLTFQERPGDCFDAVRERIRAGRPIRSLGTDYLAYALIDAVVDHYFPILETIGELLEDMEDKVLENPSAELLADIRGLRRKLVSIRRSIWPLREMLARMTREDLVRIGTETRLYLRDCHDHVLRILDLFESYREQIVGLMDAYMTAVSNRMNEVMKVLTIIATIFIPLSFVVGLYGMNFNPHASPLNMPELNWYLGYPAVLVLMLVIAVVMLLFFIRKGWIGAGRSGSRGRRGSPGAES